MESTVDDFLSEINDIAPLSSSSNKQFTNVWEKCYDESSGFHYYWNTKTDEVTWDEPPNYKSTKHDHISPKKHLYMPPRTAPLFPSTSGLLDVADSVKIYKIGKCSSSQPIKTDTKEQTSKIIGKVISTKKKIVSKPYKPNSDSEDERIVLISSYGGDSDSEEENSENSSKKQTIVSPKSPQREKKSENEVKETKSEKEVMKSVEKIILNQKKEISGFSLVAGYSDSEEENDNEEETIEKIQLPIIAPPPEPPSENQISYSTLFPITKPIDIKDFEEKTESTSDSNCNNTVENSNFDSKILQRKRRIAVDLVNNLKKHKTEEVNVVNERTGFGFNSNTEATENNSQTYPGFKSGGVVFIKTDILNPLNDTEIEKNQQSEKVENVDEIYTTLKEKLVFLSEGREPVSPVQIMQIQLETLIEASKGGDLKQTYLKKWLEETCSDLIKLEKETTPEGWLLQWDRSHKRYYYQNEATGESQWDYPELDVTSRDEAMDISTTPPPCDTEQAIHMSPPLPPTIASPSPPPPPKISDLRKKNNCDIPLPPEVNVMEKCSNNGEPLPPGVDISEETDEKAKSIPDLSDALNLFYSDIAAIENNSNSPPPCVSGEEKKANETENLGECAKKKKKLKTKMAQGIAMKKKGVSKLVEKWKNVQMSYND